MTSIGFGISLTAIIVGLFGLFLIGVGYTIYARKKSTVQQKPMGNKKKESPRSSNEPSPIKSSTTTTYLNDDCSYSRTFILNFFKLFCAFDVLIFIDLIFSIKIRIK